MKTSGTVQRQEERKMAEGNDHSLRENTEPVTQKRRRGDESYKARIAPFKWSKGFCPNPGGRPKHDLAAELAKAIFEQNGPALYNAYLKAALKGNGYIFETLANRAFGKLKETVAVDVNPLRDLSDHDLKARIAELEARLGYAPALPPSADDPKPN